MADIQGQGARRMFDRTRVPHGKKPLRTAAVIQQTFQWLLATLVQSCIPPRSQQPSKRSRFSMCAAEQSVSGIEWGRPTRHLTAARLPSMAQSHSGISSALLWKLLTREDAHGTV